MIDLSKLSHEEKEALAEDCEDFLLHRNIPLFSHSYDNIIIHALREGYQMDKFDRPIRKTVQELSQGILNPHQDALLKNYIDYSIKSHQRSVYLEVNVDYHQACIEELKNGQCGYKFYIESGRKYHKIIMDAQTPPSAGAPITWPGSRSVHAFVDKKTPPFSLRCHF